jgi:hypothetical protein
MQCALGYTDIVLWARGMATAVAIECARNISASGTANFRVKFMVLDSPFISVKQMVKDASTSIKTCGVAVPKTIITLCGHVIRRSVKSRLGSDPYDVKPLELVGDVKIPCFIMSATSDDYIPIHHGGAVAEKWADGCDEDIKCSRCEFSGRHFGEREEIVVLLPVDEIRPHLSPPEEVHGVDLMRSIIPMPAMMMRGSKSSLALKGLC